MPTIDDVASLADVSISTVSRALTRPDMVAESTRERVLAAAQAIGYLHNPSARALATGRTGLLGLTVPTLANPYFGPIISGAQTAAEEAGCELVIAVSQGKPARERVLLRRLQGRVDGLVAVAPRGPARCLVEQSRIQPVVTVNRTVRGVGSVIIDTPSGLRELGRHLTELGHRRVAYVGGPPGSWMDAKRQRALNSAVSRAAGELVVLPQREPTIAAGSTSALDLVADRCTAVVAYNSVLAVGLLQQLRTMGIAVPGDISLACADDLTDVGLSVPDITALHVPAEEAGRQAIEIILQHPITEAAPNADPARTVTSRTLPVALTEGSSTAPPP